MKDEPNIMSPPARNPRRFNGGIAVNVCDRIHEACACEFESDRTMSAHQRTLFQVRKLPSKSGLSVTSCLVYGAVDRRSAHKLSHD